MVTVQNLTKKYGAKVTAVDDLSFTAREGEIYGLLGPNGAGKTTTLRIMATLLSPTSGTVTVAGYDVAREPEAVRRSVGVVNGGMGLYDRLTGREIMAYFASFYGLSKAETKRRIEDLADKLEMHDLLDRRAGEYSTGMKQKVVIGRAVLDFARAYRGAGRVVLYSTHIMNEAEELCDRAAIIDHGRLVAEDTVPALKARAGTSGLEEAFFRLTREGGAERPLVAGGGR